MSTNEQSMKNAIGAFLKNTRLAGKLTEQKLIDSWAERMGKPIAKHTKEIYIRDKTLFLSIDSAPLRQELFYSKEKLVKMLNEGVGEEVIKEIVFR